MSLGQTRVKGFLCQSGKVAGRMFHFGNGARASSANVLFNQCKIGIRDAQVELKLCI
jgi:hypothetical protein